MCRRVLSEVYILPSAAQRPIRTTETFVSTSRRYTRIPRGTQPRDYHFKLYEMRTRINLGCFICCLLIVTIIGMTIACADLEPARLASSDETIGSDILLQKFVDCLKNRYMSTKARHGKRSDAASMMELNATWEILKMIQDVQNEQRRQENIRQNKEQILLRDFPSSNADEYTSYDAIQSGSLPDVIGKYYNDVQ